jgi:hypothetical protein
VPIQINPSPGIGQAQCGMAKYDTNNYGNEGLSDCTHVGLGLIFHEYNSGELPPSHAARFLEPSQ